MGVKSFIKKSVAFVSALAMACSMVVMPAGASYAAEEGNPLQLNKTAELQDNGTYKITLEAWAKGEVKVETEKSGTPLDIVLVLDQSGSMYNSSYLDPLKTAVTGFVNTISQNAKEYNVDHRIALVGYASNETDGDSDNGGPISGSSSSWINTGLFVNGKLKNYETPSGYNKVYSSDLDTSKTYYIESRLVGYREITHNGSGWGYNNIYGRWISVTPKTSANDRYNTQVYEYTEGGSLTAQDYKDSLVNVNTDGSVTSSITTAISNIGANGATRTSYGMEMANKVFENNPLESGSKRKRIVVVFTDGQPGQLGYSSTEASSAVSKAYITKQTHGATVYTVGLYSSTNEEEVNNFMNYLSSNYPEAQNMGEPGTASTEQKYYMTTSNSSGLDKIFENISNDIIGGVETVELDQTAVAKDIISNSFDLPEGYDKSKVTVKTADYQGDGSWATAKTFKDAQVSIDTTNKTINVTNFNYKENYVAEANKVNPATGKKLIIEISDVVANTAGLQLDTNDANSGVYDGNGNLAGKFPQPKVDIDSKSYVLDYGKTVSTAAADYGVNAVTIANTGKPSPYSIDLTGDYGTFAISNGALNYTPGKINWDGIDTGYIFGAKSDQSDITTADPSAYKWEEVNFIPATSVYYEDDFGSFTTDNPNQDANVAIVWTGEWSEDSDKLDEGENSKKDNSQSSDNVKYGWDDSYADDNEYSNGSAHYSSDSSAKATFRFTGTGVDVYSRTTPTEGRVIAKIKRVVKGENGSETLEAVKTSIIDNQSVSGNYYQIPTLTFDNLTYGTYEVTIMVSPITSENRLVYYLDGIRVYNPLQGNVTAEEIYQEVGEGNAQYIQVRKDLLDTSKVTAIDSEISGSVFIDKSKDTVGDSTNAIGTYETYGPKNEVYLKSDEKSTQGVAFTIKNYNPNVNKVFIGLKSPTGNKVTAEITSGTQKVTKDISSASDLYYEITPTADGKVVIKNTTNNLLSITKIRITTSNSASAQSYSLRATPELMSYVDEFDTLEVKEETTEDKDTTLDKDDVEIDNPTEDNNAEEGSNTSNSIWQKIMNSINKWFR